jgi:hypothetical protein
LTQIPNAAFAPGAEVLHPVPHRGVHFDPSRPRHPGRLTHMLAAFG